MKSPIKAKPLRNPGQSLDEYIYTYKTEEILPYVMAAVFFFILAGLEWFR